MQITKNCAIARSTGWQVSGDQRSNRLNRSLKSEAFRVTESRNQALGTLPAHLGNCCNNRLSMCCESNSFDASIYVVLATRKNSDPVERIDGAPRGCY